MNICSLFLSGGKSMYVKYNREYVTMYIEVLPEGQVVPLSILWKDGRKFAVEQVINIKNNAPAKSGGRATKYTLIVQGQTRDFLVDNGKWFVETRSFF